MPAVRRLAAILAADVAGYSPLMGADEEGTLAALRTVRRELGDPKSLASGLHRQDYGDGLLVEFASVVGTVRCAAEEPQSATMFQSTPAARVWPASSAPP
jgi:adenylate cyclase